MLDDIRRQINGHILQLRETSWRCLHCRHWFEAASDANGWFCGDPCVHLSVPAVPEEKP